MTTIPIGKIYSSCIVFLGLVSLFFGLILVRNGFFQILARRRDSALPMQLMDPLGCMGRHGKNQPGAMSKPDEGAAAMLAVLVFRFLIAIANIPVQKLAGLPRTGWRATELLCIKTR